MKVLPDARLSQVHFEQHGLVILLQFLKGTQLLWRLLCITLKVVFMLLLWLSLLEFVASQDVEGLDN